MAGTDVKKASSREPGMLGKSYLIAYNSIQVLGWSYLLYQIALYYTTNTFQEKRLWDAVKPTVIIFQNAAVLEIVNAMMGLVKTSVLITAVQVYSRVLVVCGVLIGIDASADSIGVPLALICWSITEIIRYSYYAASLVNFVPYFLLWCRYTFFIILYPVGVSGELLCMYAAILYVGEHKTLCLELPNAWNATFSYQYFLIVNFLGYIPGFPPLYLHMFSQRKKILGSKAVPEGKRK